jgi:hypothetical protein
MRPGPRIILRTKGLLITVKFGSITYKAIKITKRYNAVRIFNSKDGGLLKLGMRKDAYYKMIRFDKLVRGEQETSFTQQSASNKEIEKLKSTETLEKKL